MKDKFIDFVSFSIFKFEELQSNNSTENYIKLELSADQFSNFLSSINKKTINKKIEAIIYDEGITDDYYTKELRQRIIKKLNTMNFKSIKFILSDNTLPIYNHLMNIYNWKHATKTTITLKIDRNPISSNIRTWNLSEATGTLVLPEEKLIWIPDNELFKLQGKIDENVLHNSLKLKQALIEIDKLLKEYYQIENMNNFDKVYLIYTFIRLQTNFSLNTSYTIENDIVLNQNEQSSIKDPYNTLINKIGTSEGKARLMAILLNNPLMRINATTIDGSLFQNRHTWVGIVLGDKLYQCCTSIGPFRNLDELGYHIGENIDQIYPSIYEHAYLPEQEIKRIERKVKSLRK